MQLKRTRIYIFLKLLEKKILENKIKCYYIILYVLYSYIILFLCILKHLRIALNKYFCS